MEKPVKNVNLETLKVFTYLGKAIGRTEILKNSFETAQDPDDLDSPHLKQLKQIQIELFALSELLMPIVANDLQSQIDLKQPQ